MATRLSRLAVAAGGVLVIAGLGLAGCSDDADAGSDGEDVGSIEPVAGGGEIDPADTALGDVEPTDLDLVDALDVATGPHGRVAGGDPKEARRRPTSRQR